MRNNTFVHAFIAILLVSALAVILSIAWLQTRGEDFNSISGNFSSSGRRAINTSKTHHSRIQKHPAKLTGFGGDDGGDDDSGNDLPKPRYSWSILLHELAVYTYRMSLEDELKSLAHRQIMLHKKLDVEENDLALTYVGMRSSGVELKEVMIRNLLFISNLLH